MNSPRKMINQEVYLTKNESTILYLRHHPIFAAETLFNIKLNWIQRLALWSIWNKSFGMLVWGRRNGKTYIGAIASILLCMLYPGEHVLIVAPGKKQVDFIFLNELIPLYQRSSYFRACVKNKIVVTNAYNRIVFTNGSRVEAFPVGSDGGKARGSSASFLWIDEFAQMSESVVNMVFKPMLAVKHKNRFNRYLVTSSAFYRWNHLFTLFQFYKIKAITDPKHYFVYNFNYTHLLKSKHLPVDFDMNIVREQKETMTESEFAMEWLACVKPDTLISTKDGMKEIRDISVGEEVLTHTGNYKKVTKVFKREVNEEVVVIDIKNPGCESLVITKNHKVYIWNNKKNYFEWKEAGKLKVDNILIYPASNQIKINNGLALTDNCYAEYRIRDIYNIEYFGYVYNLAVEEDNSYIANYITVHNCFPTDIEGFFSSQLIENSTPRPPDKEPVELELIGDNKSDYYIGIDVGRMEGGSNFSISVIKVNKNVGRLVNVITANGATFQVMAEMIRRKFADFNPRKMMLDAGGGGTTIRDLLREKWDDYVSHKAMAPIITADDTIKGYRVLEMVNITDEIHNQLHMNLKSEMEHGRFLLPINLYRDVNKDMERVGNEIIAFKTEMQVMTAKPKGKYLRFEVPNKFRTDRVMSTALCMEGYLQVCRNYSDGDDDLPVGRWINK